MSRTRARILAVASGAVLLAGLGGDIGHAVASRAGGSKLRAYGEDRARVVAAQSGSLADGFVMLAGDSYAELALPEPFSGGRRVLNAGISGAKTEDYLAFLDALHLKHRPAVVVVTLGTDHLLRKRNPATREAGDRHEADLAAIVTRLSAMADRVVLAAVPPLAATADDFDSAGVTELTKRQAAVCARLACETADPYRSYRGAEYRDRPARGHHRWPASDRIRHRLPGDRPADLPVAPGARRLHRCNTDAKSTGEDRVCRRSATSAA